MAAATAALIGTGAVGFLGSMAEADSLKLQGEYQKQQFEFNKKLAELAADDALDRGDAEAGAVRKRGKQMVGEQRAALAAQGIDVDIGSAADLQSETEAKAAQDVITTKNNAWREAWGYRMQALNYGAQGDQALSAAKNRARNTIITGGVQALGTGVKAFGGA